MVTLASTTDVSGTMVVTDDVSFNSDVVIRDCVRLRVREYT